MRVTGRLRRPQPVGKVTQITFTRGLRRQIFPREFAAETSMKRFCFLAVMMLASSSADAGGSVSFTVRGHRVHIEASRHCRAISCASVSISGINRRISDRDDADRMMTGSVRSLPVAPAPAASPPAPPINNPSAIAAAPPPAVYRPAASTTQTVIAPPDPLPPVQPAAIPLPPPPPPAVVKQVETAPPTPAPPQISRVSRDVEDEPVDTPIGDWQTEGKGMVRIAKCGTALCGYVLNPSSDERGEAVLINMKPKTDRQWTGGVYSRDSGDTYYGTMSLKGSDTLRVEACALGRFYCSGNNWSRIIGRAESLMSSRQASAAPRS
jgi:hypothetical protein